MKGSEPAKVHVRPTIRVDFTNLKKVLKDLQKTKPSTLMNVSGWWKVIAEGEVIAYFPEKQDAQDYWDNLGDLDWTIEEIK
jgi:cytochrome c2